MSTKHLRVLFSTTTLLGPTTHEFDFNGTEDEEIVQILNDELLQLSNSGSLPPNTKVKNILLVIYTNVTC